MKTLAMTILFIIVGNGYAQTETAKSSPATTKPSWNEIVQSQQIEPGMSAELAIKLIGREPDDKEMVGAACGVFEVLTWHGENARIVTMGGNVISRD